MKKIKIAQIGTSANSHGNFIWQSLLKQSEIFEVVGYALPEGEREKFPDRMSIFDGHREMTVEEILSDPEIEAVAVETEEIYLTKYALMVAMAGKHLHMEKPGGTDLAEFRSLVRQLKEKELVFSVGYMYRFNPEIKRAIERIKAGKLGRIYSVDAEMSCKHPGEVREWLGAFPGGMMFFLGCHLIDIIYTIMGEPTQVIPLSCSTDPEGFGTEDFGMAVFKYPCGVSFAKTSASEYGGFLHRRLAISGECGSIEIRPLEAQDGEGLYSVTAEANSESWHEPWRTERSECFDRYDCMMRNFAELVRGKENPYSYDYELGLYELILKSSGK